jgi:hypothetical protein
MSAQSCTKVCVGGQSIRYEEFISVPLFICQSSCFGEVLRLNIECRLSGWLVAERREKRKRRQVTHLYIGV